MERTVVLLKPDVLQRGLVGRIIARLEDRVGGLEAQLGGQRALPAEVAAMRDQLAALQALLPDLLQARRERDAMLEMAQRAAADHP